MVLYSQDLCGEFRMGVAKTNPEATSLATPPSTYPPAQASGKPTCCTVLTSYTALPGHKGILGDSVSCSRGVGNIETRKSVPVPEPFPGKQESWTQGRVEF